MKTKNIITFLTLAAVAVSCGGSGKHVATVNFTRTALSIDSREALKDSSFKVSLAYEMPADAPDFLRDSIVRHTRTFFSAWFDVSELMALETAVKKSLVEHVSRVKENRLPYVPVFELDIAPADVYQNGQIVSIAYNWSLYEGGAHGNFGRYSFTLDKRDGSRLTAERLIKNGKTEEFMALAEAEFKKQSGMKPDEKMYSVYNFENDRFALSHSFVFTPTALVFYYNPYEIAPYSAGLIQLSLPYEQFGEYLNFVRK